jgi:hypothetical protein
MKRRELYDLVWSESMKTLAARYGISDVALAKTCRHHDIPTPPRGHWVKIQAGKKSVRQSLPLRGFGMPETIQIGGTASPPYWPYYSEPKGLIEMEIPPPPEFLEPLSDLIARVRKLAGKVSVPEDLANAHQLIARLLKEDETRREKRLSWEGPLFDSPFELRRLRLLSAIFGALERCRMKPSLRGNDPIEFGVRVGDERISFMLDRPGQERDGYRRVAANHRAAPDKLQLKIFQTYKLDEIPLVWEDKARGPIERKVKEIVVGIMVAGEAQCRLREVSFHNWLIERKAALIEQARKRKAEEERLERERRIKAEEERINRLLGEAAAFRQASDIRAYVENVRRANAVIEEPASQEELDVWSSWALAQADRIDPVRSKKFLK